MSGARRGDVEVTRDWVPYERCLAPRDDARAAGGAPAGSLHFKTACDRLVFRLGDGAGGQLGCHGFNFAWDTGECTGVKRPIGLGRVALASRDKEAAVLLLLLHVVLKLFPSICIATLRGRSETILKYISGHEAHGGVAAGEAPVLPRIHVASWLSEACI